MVATVIDFVKRLLARKRVTGVGFIPLSQGLFAMVDAADLEELGEYKWCVCRMPNGSPYAARNVPMKNGKQRQTLVYMHRQLCPTRPGYVVDHIKDHQAYNTLNNRRRNLRELGSVENMQRGKHHKQHRLKEAA